jgi:hypothetical protein
VGFDEESIETLMKDVLDPLPVAPTVGVFCTGNTRVYKRAHFSFEMVSLRIRKQLS